VEVIGHQANCQNTFGSGIARSIKEMYPEAYEIDCISAAKKRNNLGTFSAVEVAMNGKVNRYNNHIRRIYNLYGQNLGTNHAKYDRKTNYEALYSALEAMADSLMPAAETSLQQPIVGFPYLMGSGLGGGDFRIVQRLIEVAFDGYENDVIIVKYKE
jgi:O-acetyl-ADP-ribose deacetylase (regulator of RNase III)